MSNLLGSDPKSWSVTEVSTWIGSLVNSEKIAEQFLDNDIDGTILLHDVDDAVLKTELEIKSFGKRCKILKGIETLRNGNTGAHSDTSKFGQSTGQSSVNSPSSVLSLSPSHTSKRGISRSSENQKTIMDSPVSQVDSAHEIRTEEIGEIQRLDIFDDLTSSENVLAHPYEPLLDKENFGEFELSCDFTTNTRELASLDQPTCTVTSTNEFNLQQNDRTNNLTNEYPSSIAASDPPTHSPKVKVKRAPVVTNTKPPPPRLPPYSLKEEHLFFTPLQLRRVGDATFQGVKDDETEVEYVYRRKKDSQKFVGEASIAQRRLKRMLRELTLFDSDENTTAHQLSKNPQVPVRLFRVGDEGVGTRLTYVEDLIHSNEDTMSKFKAVASVPDVEASANVNTSKVDEEEGVLPLYGDSDWEDYEFDSELERELKKENRLKKTTAPDSQQVTSTSKDDTTRALSKEMIEQAIQKFVDYRAAQWRKNKLAEFEHQKVNTYQKEKRTLPIKEVALRSLKERLEKQTSEISNKKFYSEEDVLQCCEHSELGFTLDSMSVLEWKIALLKGPEPIAEEIPASSQAIEIDDDLPQNDHTRQDENKKENGRVPGNGSISTTTPPPRSKPGNSSISTGTPPPHRRYKGSSPVEPPTNNNPPDAANTLSTTPTLRQSSEDPPISLSDNGAEVTTTPTMKAKLPLAAKSSMSNKMGMPLFLNHRGSFNAREESADEYAPSQQVIISSSEDENLTEPSVSRLSSIESLPNDNSNRLETYDNPDDIPPGYVYMSRHQEKKADPIVLSSSSDDESDPNEKRKRRPDSYPTRDSNSRGKLSSNSKRYRMELKNARAGRKNIRKIQAESDQVLRIRQETQRKAREVEDRIRMSQRKYEGTSFAKDAIKLLINPGHDKSQSDVYILPELAAYLKPHQIEGVRFMWKNIVMFNGQGCVLSHAMGLGKTFQVITFLFTLMRENRLGNSTIPQKLKPNRILILCPPTLIENWHNEFYKWIPREHLRVIGWVYKLGNACKRIDEKIDFLQKWYRFGGILLMGYQAFRDLVSNQGRVVQTFEQSEEIRKILLEAPSVVIADEGHIIKNPTTKISLYIKQLQTKSRICLTGYPLQNNLEEYWCMVDFVYPMFLGSLPDFRNAYINPINNGLYPDSTPGDRKLSSTKLYVLSGIISEIVLRKDASVLHRDLPEKVEYIIACKLTNLQYQLYTGFLRSQMNDAKTYTNENIIAKGHVLLQICNHPCVFKTAVVSSNDGEKGRSGVSAFETRPKHAEAEEITIIDLENERPEELPEVQQEMKKIEPTGYGWTKELFDKVEDPADIAHCHKMNMLMEILVACKNINEKVLVFSRSIPTLDYIEHVLKHYKYQHFKYLRLDGETPIQNRQDMIDRFNQETSFDVFLISSGAGSLGVNLVSANRVVIYDVGWNPSFDEQAIARAYRYGQQRKVYVYRLQTYSTFEDKLFKNNVHKVGLFVRVVDKKNPGKLFTKDQMKRYLDFPESKPESKLSITQFDDPVINQTVSSNKDAIIEITLHSTLLNEVEGDLTAEDKCQAQSLLEHERRLRNPINGGSSSQPTPDNPLTFIDCTPTATNIDSTQSPIEQQQVPSLDGKSIPESMMPVSLNPET